MCGENCILKVKKPNGEGSPPRVRGKLVEGANVDTENRITPACAGKTSPVIIFPNCARDHPRVCGENCCQILCGTAAAGSPPRVRGKPTCRRTLSTSARITPACAGKTWRNTLGLRGAQDHPRVCGENSAGLSSQTLSRGSPPRVRGKPDEKDPVVIATRITPACAGKT